MLIVRQCRTRVCGRLFRVYDLRTNSYLQNIEKSKIEQHEFATIPPPHMAPVVLLLLQTR